MNLPSSVIRSARKIILLFMGVFLFSLAALAQQKYERESRLSEKDVPSPALEFIHTLDIPVNVKWFLEEGLDRTSIEAKFKYNNRKHSIEFDTTGILEDVEIEYSWNSIPSTVKATLREVLEKDCASYSIRKVQYQYTGSPAALKSLIQPSSSPSTYTLRYEIVVRCRMSKEVGQYEYLFDDDGQQLSRSKIIFNNTSHLEY